MMHWISLYKKFADCIPKEQLVDCSFILLSGHAPLLQGDASHWAGSPLPWRHFFPNSLSFLNLKCTRLILWILHCWFDTRWLYSMSHSELPEKAMASHSRTLAWKIPWKEEPGRLRSMGLLRVGHSWAISLSLFTFMHWRRKWQSTPEFLPGESQGWGSLVGFRLWVTQSRTRLKRLSSSSSSSSELHLYALEKLSVPPTNYRGTYHTSLLFFLPPSLIQISTMSWLFQKLFIEFSMCQIPYKAHTQVREFYMPLSS